jgi:hypothetical protein
MYCIAKASAFLRNGYLLLDKDIVNDRQCNTHYVVFDNVIEQLGLSDKRRKVEPIIESTLTI